MVAEPDFYLTSSEHKGDLRRVRRCWALRRPTGPFEQQYLWVRVEPPFIGHAIGRAADIGQVLLSPHYEGGQLFPLRDLPVSVYIYLPRRDQVLGMGHIEGEDVELAAWGEIYRSEAEAAEVANTP